MKKDAPTKNAVFAFAIEDALNEVGPPTLEIVNNALIQKYHCTILDCLDKPEYLADVLKEIFGYAYVAVLGKIKNKLGKFSSEQVVNNLLTVLSR